MKYYKDANENIYADPSSLEGLEEVTNPVRADGTILPNHDRLKDLKTDSNGNYYKYYKQDGTPDIELVDKLKNDKRVASIKAKAGELILEEYPIYKQNNVLMGGVQEDIDTMKSYIEDIREISNNAEADGTLLEDIDWTR
jgi:hypothetical protein